MGIIFWISKSIILMIAAALFIAGWMYGAARPIPCSQAQAAPLGPTYTRGLIQLPGTPIPDKVQPNYHAQSAMDKFCAAPENAARTQCAYLHPTQERKP